LAQTLFLRDALADAGHDAHGGIGLVCELLVWRTSRLTMRLVTAVQFQYQYCQLQIGMVRVLA
jgi:hypothetical protein